MPKSLMNRWHGLHVLGLAFIVALIAVLSVYEWVWGVIGLLLFAPIVYYIIVTEKALRNDINSYVTTLSYRIKRAGNEVITELPIGIVLYSEDRMIEWHNPFISKMMNKESLIGVSLTELFPALLRNKDSDYKLEMTLGTNTYEVIANITERLLYFTDITDYSSLSQRYEEEKMALGIIMMDNLDEATQGMDDQSRSIMLAKVTGEITNWADKHQAFLRRFAADKFLFMGNQIALQQLEQTKFDILDDVRDLTTDHKLPFTLSIGMATGVDSLIELGHLAQTSLDMALGRGGDQAAVKAGERLSFYGGRSNAMEKRTRVRARVISHALRDLIKECDKVMIMGHRIPDMDSIGAAIGVLKAAQVMHKEAYIVLEGNNPSIENLMAEIKENERLNKWFITPAQAMQITTERTLAVVVDTHKASMVAEPKLLQLTQRIVVVDHHRRSEGFIHDAILIYMEPYASSTCELVTELLQYFYDPLTMEVLEATALLAGIVVDTKSFSLRTGARTFEAASFLRRKGADSVLIQRLLKEDFAEYLKKVDIIKQAQMIYKHIAVVVAEPGHKYSQLLIAKVADTLLTMTDVRASFVICERSDGLIGISARSLGQINVQVIMERLGGGGHLTNAAAQLEGPIEQAAEQLRGILQQMDAEEGLFE